MIPILEDESTFPLLDLHRRARAASSTPELRFLLVNDTRLLAPYRQAVLWMQGSGVQALSGVVQAEANAPYVQWLGRLFGYCSSSFTEVHALEARSLNPEIAAEWGDWLPQYALWLPIAQGQGSDPIPKAGLLLAREQPWSTAETAALVDWLDAWRHAWHAMEGASSGFVFARSWRRLRQGLLLRTLLGSVPDSAIPMPWWRRRWLHISVTLLAVSMFPVRMTVMAPAELVPSNPEVIRSPLDGVIDFIQVRPNQHVSRGQSLFRFDESLIRSKLEVARQAQATAEAEYRQSLQLAIVDMKTKAALPVLIGRIDEKRAEVELIREQIVRAKVVAPRDGVVLFDDPSEWIGRPVVVGERIMRVAALEDVEVEVWLGLGDAIPLPPEAEVTLYLNADPLAPVQARLRYQAHDAVQRPDGGYAYRLRARLHQPTAHRVGLKGTARVSGQEVPLGYWIARRPWAAIRTYIGW